MPPLRARVDACPGALTLHEAADGLLARVRLPGGVVSGAQLAVLAELARRCGDGRLELTSRGNVQLRGLTSAAQVAGPLAGAGLLPSATHERVRNVVASPLSGLDGSPDVQPVVRSLDEALCARPGLAGLPGRFLFAVDDGRGDVAGLDADITLWPGDSVAAALDAAERFLELQAEQGGTAWRVAELDPAARPLWSSGAPVGEHAGRQVPPAGIVPQPAGRSLLIVLAPLGRLDESQLGWLVDQAGARGLRITPWRSVVVPDLIDAGAAARAAAALGLGVDAASPWYRVSACTGRPGCAKAHADVQHDARAAAARWPGRTVRWSGCERRCGRPRDTEIDVVATEQGYRVEQ